tara:strand:+ start:270 stop:572 length:303 start_codon:yes stop_codon:yes gene_type:complete
MKKINKKSLAEFLESRYDNITKGEAENIINSLFWKIEQELKEGNEVSIVGFGKFFTKRLDERISTNPQTGEKFHKEARDVVKFRIGKNLKHSIKNKDKDK